MAKLYEWEEFLTPSEADNVVSLWKLEEHYRGLAKDLAAARDSVRRKCVQRARNALNKELRAAHRERVK